MEEKNKGYILGILGALLGALIGTIPWIILYVYGNMIYSILAFVVAIAALKGYELLKGKVDKKLPFIIAIVSVLAITIATLVIIPNLLLVKEIGTTSLANFKMLYSDSEFTSALIGDYITSLLFTALGMAGVISSINKQVKNGATKIDLNYNEVKISDEEKGKIKEVFVKYNALDKNSAVSKEMLLRDEDITEDSINYLVSIGVVKVYKKNYYYVEKNEQPKNNKAKSWIIIGVVFVILLLVGIFSTGNNEEDTTPTETREISYTIPEGYQEYEYDDETGEGWYYLPNKDLTGESGFIDVSFAENEEAFTDYEEVKENLKVSFEDAGYTLKETDEYKNDNGYQVLVYVIDFEDYEELIYYIFNENKYAIVDGFNYYDVANSDIKAHVKDIAENFDWN